jgi:hypothetical protein
VYSIENHRYLDLEDARRVVDALGLSFVPIIEENIELDGSVSDWEEKAYMKSTMNPKAYAEGIVVRPMKEGTDVALGRFSFKVLPPKGLVGKN